MPNIKMRREEKRDLILLCRVLEGVRGARHGVKYSRNAGASREKVRFYHPNLSYLLLPKNAQLRNRVVFYYRGWGWRVRSGWRDTIKGIECTNQRIYKAK